MQLHVFHDQRAAAFGLRGRGRHGRVEGAGSHEAIEDPVVVQPLGIRRDHFRFERNFSASGLVADAHQGVTGGWPPVPGRLEPVAAALKWIARQ